MITPNYVFHSQPWRHTRQRNFKKRNGLCSFGVRIPETVTTIGFAFFKVQEAFLKLNDPRIVLAVTKIYTEEMLNLFRGQGMELYLSKKIPGLTEEEFLQTTGLRSAVAFTTVVRIMQEFSENKIDLSRFCVLLGKCSFPDTKCRNKYSFSIK